jgi:uncharacterized protein (TIGR03435 family)
VIRAIGRTSLIVLTSVGISFGQPATLAFEVAAIRPTTHSQDRGANFSFSGSHFTFTNGELWMLIAFAYNIRGSQLVGGPSWVRSEKYDVTAKADGDGNRSEDEVRAMLRPLMADRFKLAVHRENRDLSVYALTVGKNGPKFAEAKERGPNDFRGTRGHFTSQRSTLATLAGYLGSDVRNFVFDETGLTGQYAITLDWNPEETQLDGGAGNSSRPSLFTALQEQLGLKLESVKRPVEHIVIDHVERPSEN